jgi:hypothetical protein
VFKVKRHLLLSTVYSIIAVAFSGLCISDVSQTLYWVTKYDIALDWLTWVYLGINIVCRVVVSVLLVRLAVKEGRKVRKCGIV